MLDLDKRLQLDQESLNYQVAAVAEVVLDVACLQVFKFVFNLAQRYKFINFYVVYGALHVGDVIDEFLLIVIQDRGLYLNQNAIDRSNQNPNHLKSVMNLKAHLNKLGLIPKNKANYKFQAENKQELVLALTNYFSGLDQLDFFQISKNIIENQFSEDSQQLKSKLKLQHFADQQSLPQQDFSRSSSKLAFDRLYCQGGINSLKKVILKQKALQELDKQCTFAPKINSKKTQKVM